MRKRKGKISSKAGLPPGSLVLVGESYPEPHSTELISYNPTFFERIQDKPIQELLRPIGDHIYDWYNVYGLGNIEAIQQLGNHFGLHPLLQEDILNTESRPRFEETEGHLFVSLKSLHTIQDHSIDYEQISLILGDGYLISIQEKQGDLFHSLRERLMIESSRLRQQKTDYLFYRILDVIVDGYFVVLENISDRIEQLEEEVVLNPQKRVLQDVQALKKELIYLRKALYPVREVINRARKDGNRFITPETERHLSDVYDHIIHAIETAETLKDLAGGLMDIYLTSVSNKMNEVMKVLTVIATIFIPLTFIVGIYGMNFEQMPELRHPWGYPMVMAFMGLVAVGMLGFFKWKRWF
jgi:magnesium transporter